MDERKYGRARAPKSFWSRRSRRTKLLIIAVAVGVVVLSLGLGLGIGLGLNRSNNSGGGSDNFNITASPLPPTPTNKGIWQPAVGTSWQIVLPKSIILDPSATSIDPDVDVFDLDLFLTPKSTIDTLHKMGKRVLCYFSAGSYEPDRPDSNNFKSGDMGNNLDGWPGEKWLNLNSNNVRNIMVKRLQLASQKGCDGVDPDNTDAYDNKNGLGMTPNDSINFLRFLAGQAQNLGLAIGLKNSGTIIPYVLPGMQWEVNEQCVQHSECTTFAPFISAGKPVFHIEYPDQDKSISVSTFCGNSGQANGTDGFSTVLKNYKLDGWVQYCNGVTATTPT